MGAKEGVAKKAAENINKMVGREIVVGSYSPKFGFENDIVETEKMILEEEIHLFLLAIILMGMVI